MPVKEIRTKYLTLGYSEENKRVLEENNIPYKVVEVLELKEE